MLSLRSLLPASLLTIMIAFSPHVRADEEKLGVVATFSIIGDFATIVGGDRINLKTLVGPDSDAHVYEPRPADAIALARADVVLVNGLSLEGFLDRLIEASETTAEITVLTEGADILMDPNGGHYHYINGRSVFHATPTDPHAWQSVANAKVFIGNIARAFCSADAEGCPKYEANAATYHDKLSALDMDIRNAIADLPEDRRVAVVAHNAFRYFERDYGVTFLAPQGVSTESEASAADVASLIREIRERRARAVFSENITDARLVEQIASEAGLALAGPLYTDALSPADGPAPGYLELMRHNLNTLTDALNAD